MAKHKFQQTLARLLREIVQLFKTLTGKFVRWFLRTILVTKRWRQGQASGFVLPTVIFMLMVVALVVAAILFRTFTRTSQVIQQGQAQIIQNAATPAIERAKSKLEYLFDKDLSSPGAPGDKDIEEAMFNDDIYSLPDERRVTLNVELDTEKKLVNAWYYDTDTDGKNGADIRTIYAIVSRSERDKDDKTRYTVDPDAPETEAIEYEYLKEREKRADRWVVSNGPLATDAGGGPTCPNPPAGAGNGWFDDPSDPSSGIIKKNFQVYALSVPYQLTQPSGAVANPGISTLQYQQDRTFRRGNTWGAWFRNDLELFPGEAFNWNGAIHSEGSLFFNTGNANGKLRFFLISAPNSCFFNPALNSDINAKHEFVIATIGNNNTTMQGSKQLSIDIHPDYQNIAVTPANDSVTPDSIKPIDIAIDPILLLTEGKSESRNSDTWDPILDWKKDDNKLSDRVERGLGKCPPYIDDTYRADNLYGPKPSYDKGKPDDKGECQPSPADGTIGAVIADRTDLTAEDPPGPGLEDEVGLDGYWERRARNEGLRVIVGQRLELGNPFGWNVDVDDSDGDGNVINDVTPVNPTDEAPTDRALYSPDAKHKILGTNRANEGRQYVTLRDNLAAVQATAIYHHTHENGDFPIAFVATTAHPGTQKTLENSTTFAKPTDEFNITTGAASSGVFSDPIFGNGNNEILSNFLMGEGTNGWEFNVVPGTGAQTLAAFQTLISSATSPLRKALDNLANFAGDPDGAYPPKQDNNTVHPYPKLTMWGNFSNLRRTLKTLSSSGGYNSLSPADKTNLHTAAGTLGMLAYNISYLQDFDYKSPTTPASDKNKTILTKLDTRLKELAEGTDYSKGKVVLQLRNPTDTTPSATNPYEVKIYQRNSNATSAPLIRIPIGSTLQAPPPDAFIAALESQVNAQPAVATGTTLNDLKDDLERFKLLHLKEQVERDRKFGFQKTPQTPNIYEYTVRPAAAAFTYAGVTYTAGNKINLGCDFSDPSVAAGTRTGNNFFGFGVPTTDADEQRFIRLATSLCPSQPKFPSLYYLFPKYTHNHQGQPPATLPATLTAGGLTQDDYLQPGAKPTDTVKEPYIVNDAIPNQVDPYMAMATVNGNKDTYKIINSANTDDFSDIALLPRATTAWKIPKGTANATTSANIITDRATTTTAQRIAVPFLDKGMYDGRELMNERLLDFDLDMLRRNDINNSDSWLPETGLVYAFREDAVREDAIARPSGTKMDVWNSNPTDPELINGISPKPVDYYPDPDRRSYGFRLRNGITLKRETATYDTGKGISFISDNPVYIQGDFNVHSSNATVANRLEEFSDKIATVDLSANPNRFYERGDNAGEVPNPDFAKKDKDTWRSSEVLADAVNILSNTWNEVTDGTIQSGILANNKGTKDASGNPNNANKPSSYQNGLIWKNGSYPVTTGEKWICENPFDPRATATTTEPLAGGCDGPIKVFRNGEIRYKPTTANSYRDPLIASYRDFFDRNRTRNTPGNTWVNTVMVSGIVPSRMNSANGGLHNFPRMHEDWQTTGKTLYFYGGLFQLNFNSYATGPYDQDSWEPDSAGATDQAIWYYRAPKRSWGYDVALQSVAAGQIAGRMGTLDDSRSEFYRELRADDLYICKLREAAEINYPCPK